MLHFLGVVVSAQQPRIDSISVDEEHDELVFHGLFLNSSNAIIKVDNVRLPLTFYSDSLLRAIIPLSGKGSSGCVNVTIANQTSNSKLLSYLHFRVYHGYTYNSVFRGEYSTNDDTLHIRANFIDAGLLQTDLHINSSKLSRCRDKSFGSLNFDSSGILNAEVVYLPKTNSLKYDIIYGEYFGIQTSTTDIQLDSNFLPIDKINSNDCGRSGGTCFWWASLAPTDFPPTKFSPCSQSSNSDTTNVYLTSNPIDQNTLLVINYPSATSAFVEFIDVYGKIVSSNTYPLVAGQNQILLPYFSLAPGAYFCRVSINSQFTFLKFIKL